MSDKLIEQLVQRAREYEAACRVGGTEFLEPALLRLEAAKIALESKINRLERDLGEAI